MSTVEDFDTGELQARIDVAERDTAEARANAKRASDQLRKAREELRQARTRIGQLERQLEGYDDKEFDPSEQKGIGAIPIGDFTGGLMDEAEIVERQLGMGPTMRSGLQLLGLGDKQTKRLLGATTPDDAHLAAALAVYPSVLQAAWKARTVLDGGPSDDVEWLSAMNAARRALNALPMAPFVRYLELEHWDESSETLPGIKTPD